MSTISSGTRRYLICFDQRGGYYLGKEEAHVVAAHVDFRQAVEAVAVRVGLDDLAQDEVHPVVAADEMAVEGLAVLELDEHWLALGGGEEAERELWRVRVSFGGVGGGRD
jgi:hypothetical protein